MSPQPTLSDIEAAYKRISGYVHQTPVMTSLAINKLASENAGFQIISFLRILLRIKKQLKQLQLDDSSVWVRVGDISPRAIMLQNTKDLAGSSKLTLSNQRTFSA